MTTDHLHIQAEILKEDLEKLRYFVLEEMEDSHDATMRSYRNTLLALNSFSTDVTRYGLIDWELAKVMELCINKVVFILEQTNYLHKNFPIGFKKLLTNTIDDLHDLLECIDPRQLQVVGHQLKRRH